MAVEIVMPRVDMDMSSGRMGRWHAAEGAHVVKGATLFEIETDKAAMEVDAPASGVLKFVAASEGDVLPVGACIGWIVADGEDFVPSAAKAETAAEAHPERDDAGPARGARPHPAPQPVLKNGRSSERSMGATFFQGEKGSTPPPQRPLSLGERAGVRVQGAGGPSVRATPAARRMARERGFRLEDVSGSGPRGRVQLRDIEQRRPAARSRSNIHRLWLQRGGGAPVVFLHGFGADLNGWRPVQRLLPERRPALAIDLPGHGLSPLGKEPTFGALVEAARAVMIEESVREAHLVGHSLGAAVAAAVAHEPPVKALSLMLIAPAGLGEETNGAFFAGFLQADTEAALTPWLHMLVVDPAALGSALARTTLRQRRERPLAAEQRRLAEAILAGGRQGFQVRGLLAEPKAPTKIVFGIEDRITPAHHADGLSGLIALHRFPGIGHMPHLEARREVAALIEELARAGAASA
jgi:pimeloyl-ACP methyl ester carboxylesterase